MYYFCLIFVPVVLIAWAWVRAVTIWHRPERPVPRVALIIATLNVIVAAAEYTFYRFHPTRGFVPPWENAEIGDMGMLYLSTPLVMLLGVIAASRKTSRSVIGLIEVACIPLLVVGFFAVVSF